MAQGMAYALQCQIMDWLCRVSRRGAQVGPAGSGRSERVTVTQGLPGANVTVPGVTVTVTRTRTRPSKEQKGVPRSDSEAAAPDTPCLQFEECMKTRRRSASLDVQDSASPFQVCRETKRTFRPLLIDSPQFCTRTGTINSPPTIALYCGATPSPTAPATLFQLGGRYPAPKAGSPAPASGAAP
jgi:hypothetical protein